MSKSALCFVLVTYNAINAVRLRNWKIKSTNSKIWNSTELLSPKRIISMI